VAVAGDNIASHIELLKQADIAMYQAKDAGKNQYCFFDNMMMEQINLRYIINSQFPESLATNQISLVFQPIVDANSGKLIKLEALSRWVHPEIGFIRPDKFIQILEETTHIDTLSEWLISQAAAKVNELDELGLTDVVVSINISGAQVSDIDSIGILMVECTKANVEYNRIELEITETSLISDFKKAQDWISKVNSMGFRIAIDDFGTGYSSLSYLTAFPFDCVKLDRSLLLDVEESQRTCNIVRSITSMIHSMDVPVVAEGIETLSHLEVIKSLGCDYVQGYYFSRPLAAKDLKLRLEEYVDSLEWKAEASN
jgi:EAL domain-containing protein (putative c-di-GMP-specific phosphodiesterase class I)